MKDTIAARNAMLLAYSFIDDVRAMIPSTAENKLHEKFSYHAQDHLNNLSLAAKEIKKAEKLDPDAKVTVQDEKQNPFTLNLSLLKSLALYHEAYCHSALDNPKRAIKTLNQAVKVFPNNAQAWWLLGVIHTNELNRGEAIHACNKALAIYPDDILYQQALARARSITGMQRIAQSTAKGVGRTISTIKFLWWAFCTFILVSLPWSIYVYVNTPTHHETAFVIMIFDLFILFVGGLFMKAGEAVRDAVQGENRD